MPLENLRDLYIHQIKDLYSAEKQITKALPKMMKAASSPELRSAFEDHLEVTQEQVARLEQILEALGENLRAPKCKGMEGLLEEGSELMEEDADESVMDAGLIVGAQKVEHYEIAGYGSARTFAELLGETQAVRLLDKTLKEEEETDRLLTELAMSINAQAEEGSETADDDDDEEAEGAMSSGARGRTGSRSGSGSGGGGSKSGGRSSKK
jgi:ferritin-like metal-binding protein YciE